MKTVVVTDNTKYCFGRMDGQSPVAPKPALGENTFQTNFTYLFFKPMVKNLFSRYFSHIFNILGHIKNKIVSGGNLSSNKHSVHLHAKM